MSTLVGIPLSHPDLALLSHGWPRRLGFCIPGARYAEQNTDQEHGPQTYLGAVASRAAVIEATPTDHEITLGEHFLRHDAVLLAFATVEPARWPNHGEQARVLAILRAGDHASDLAALR